MSVDREPKFTINEEDLPEHESITQPENLIKALERIVAARRQFAAIVKVATSSSHSFGPGGLEEFMKEALARTEHADGMVAALDLVSSIYNGDSWGNFTDLLAEQTEQFQRVE
ncbi:MAG TPA: hypothetical protein VLF88_01260 [Candidatus Babeliales bacterium]|nr:hypothetical protein [Candidatus Babeliales bacterium]